MKEIIQTIEVKRYIAEDGTTFSSMDDCIQYENDKEQESLEQQAVKELGIEITNNFPSMLDLRHKPKYMFFYIKDGNDLELFCKAYEDYWFSSKAKQLDRATFTYPEVLCILDFEQGYEDYRLYKMSVLAKQYYAFEDELNSITQKFIPKGDN